jgi:hypothetical protein
MSSVPMRIYNELEWEHAHILYKYNETVKELHELQDKNFNMMRDYADLLVYLQTNKCETYIAYLQGKAQSDEYGNN